VSDYIIRTGDMLQVTIDPPAIVPMLMAPGPLMGTSTNFKVMDQFVCLLGDQIPMAWRSPMPYTAPPFVTPGTGMLQVVLLPTNQTATTENGGVILIKGGTFQAMFNVQVPAMQPTPAGPVPDPLAVKSGTAQFITINTTTKAG
jgi:hypothetical protein